MADTVDDARQRLAYVLDDYADHDLSEVPAVKAAIDALIAAARAELQNCDLAQERRSHPPTT